MLILRYVYDKIHKLSKNRIRLYDKLTFLHNRPKVLFRKCMAMYRKFKPEQCTFIMHIIDSLLYYLRGFFHFVSRLRLSFYLHTTYLLMLYLQVQYFFECTSCILAILNIYILKDIHTKPPFMNIGYNTRCKRLLPPPQA